MPMLKIRNCCKSYGKEQVLGPVSFDVKQGEFLAILGPSGCGKTTLLRILTGLIAPDSGTIEKEGLDITGLSPEKRGIGIVFQNFALFENMTALKNISYALQHGASMSAQAAREKALQMLELVDLSDCADKYPRELSGGQQQRVAIARTLAASPGIILFDEPMASLDAENRILLRDEIKRLQKQLGATIIYVTHDQQEALLMADRVMVMEKGRIHQLDTPENLLKSPADDYVRRFVGDNFLRNLRDLNRFAGYAREASDEK